MEFRILLPFIEELAHLLGGLFGRALVDERVEAAKLADHRGSPARVHKDLGADDEYAKDHQPARIGYAPLRVSNGHSKGACGQDVGQADMFFEINTTLGFAISAETAAT